VLCRVVKHSEIIFGVKNQRVTYNIYAAATKTTRKLNMLPETDVASDFLEGEATGSAVPVRVALPVPEDKLALEVTLVFSNRM
jgi:hypothetical protein